ncbi:MAG: rhomboid family intramembrane serine protease [Desulfobulbaceae bacterium]|nr:rhomboid family intramembrane serine protease [Desulfobulbaceae bacterium]
MSEQILEQLEYIEVASSGSQHRVRLWSLVLLAVGIPNLIEAAGELYALKVPASKVERAAGELSLFFAENRDWPPPKVFGAERGETDRRPPTVLLLGGLLVFYALTGPAELGSEWFRRGAVDSTAILQQGEWWRLFTALTLHADPVHLLGNLLLGGLVIHFLLRIYGIGLGLFLTILGGALANFANVAAHGPGHLSVGFSTAVFAAVGLLAGSQLDRQRFGGIILPLGAGLSLLALLGSEGPHTDLGAHLWGLAVGMSFGLSRRLLQQKAVVAGRAGNTSARGWRQAGLLVAVFITLAGAWFLAWAAK